MNALPLNKGALFVDNSFIESLDCPRLCEHRFLDKRVSASDKAGMNFGTAGHLVWALRYRKYGTKVPDAWLAARQAKLLAWHFKRHPQPEDDHRTLNWAMELFVKRYNERYAVEPFNLLVDKGGKPLVEMPFALHLFDFVGEYMPNLPKILPIYYCGRIDLPIVRDNCIFVMDHKTTSMIGDRFWDKLRVAPQMHGYCYSPDTELLTPQGWVKICDLVENIPVMQYEEGELSFAFPTEYFKREVSENLVSFSGRVDLLTTRDHRHLLYDQQAEAYYTYRAFRVPRASIQMKFLCGGKVLECSKQLQDNILLLAVMLQADGHILPTGAIRFHFSLQRKIDRCRTNLTSFGVSFTETIQSDGTTVFYVPTTDAVSLQAQKLIGPTKIWGSWLLELPFTSLHKFIEEIQYWDGSSRGVRGSMYFSSTKENAEWVQTIAALVGRRASIHTQQSNDWKIQYRVNITNSCWVSTNAVEKTEVPYKGLVYCLNVPSSFLLTRRNGKIVVSGNCWAFPQLIETKMQVAGFYVNAIRTAKQPAKPRNGLAAWWEEALDRNCEYVRPDQIEEWRDNTIALVSDFLFQYARGYLQQKKTQCANFGRCEYYDICRLPKEERQFALASPAFVDNTWTPLKRL